MGRYFFESLFAIASLRIGVAWCSFVAFVERIFDFAFPLEPLRLSPTLDAPPIFLGRAETSAFISRRLAREQVRLGAACTYAAV